MSHPATFENRLLAALPSDEYERLLPHVEVVHFSGSHVLYEVGDMMSHAYFPYGGMASLDAIAGRRHANIGLVGSDGYVGDPIIHGACRTHYRVVVRFPMEAVRVAAGPLLAEFNRRGKLSELLLSYGYVRLTQLVQASACNFHTVSQKLCRLLLVTGDCLLSESFAFTHEDIAKMTSHSRPNISPAANKLQERGLITYHRGHITILDRQGLEGGACECYQIVKECISQSLGV